MPPPPVPQHAAENKVLAALGDSPHICSQLERVSLTQGDAVYERDQKIKYVYFPETAVFSMLAAMEDGSTVEVGPVGNEGMVGLNILFGANLSPTRVIVHVAGSAMRLKANVLRQELQSERSAISRLLLRYTRMLLAMTSQTSACHKLHPLKRQLARWLLTMQDYMLTDELLLTHELMALTLGVRRAGVTEAAGDLKDAGLIEYRRGQIHILDRQGLRVISCECYEAIKSEYDQLYEDLPRLKT